MFTTFAKLRSVIQSKGYRWFSDSVLQLNIVGVRSTNSQSNSFDDRLLVAYRDGVGREILKEYPITTDPGKPWLLKPMDPRGCAIIVPGQYLNAYMIGIHGRSKPAARQYKALEQVGKIRYVRDNNKDAVIDASLWADPKNIFEDILNTNFHRASRWSILRAVETYSAGCQVFQDPANFNEFIDLCESSRKMIMANRFTYTLLLEKDFS